MPKEPPRSLIEERLERLRRVDVLDSMSPFAAAAMRRPAGHDQVDRDYAPMDVTSEEKVYDPASATIVERVETTRTMVDANAAPFENIVARGWLNRGDDTGLLAEIRYKAGCHLRSLEAGSQVSGLKGQSYEGGGGGGGPPRPVGDHAIDCMRKLGAMKEAIPAAVYEPTYEVVCRDVWIWQGKKGGAIAKDVDLVLQGLDHIAVRLGLMSSEDVRQRWRGSSRRPQATKAEARP